MKKFLTKKATMIGSIVAAAIALVLLLVLCIRPVSVGYSYSVKTENEHYGKYTQTFHFDSFSKVTIKAEMENEEFASIGTERQYWNFVKDGVLVIENSVNSMTEEEFKAAKEEALKNWDKEEERNNGMRINAFNIKTVIDGEALEEKAVSVGAIVTVVVLAVVDAVLIAGAVASVVLRKKKALV